MRIALVHDYLTQHGGAERVLEALHELYPDAPVFTSVADYAALPTAYRAWDIHQSGLRRVPRAGSMHRLFLPLYPALFRAFRHALRHYDVVLSDSSAWSHQAPAPPHAVHVCYCHSPARFLYRDDGYLGPARIPRLLRPAADLTFAALRRMDRRAARRVDRYVANSRAVAARIGAAYGVEAAVVYPPVDLDRFASPARSDPAPEPWFLVVSRLVPHKRVDLAVAACARVGAPLKVIGDGRAAPGLRALAGPDIEFLGRLDDDAVADHLRRCRALLLPAVEDFGIIAVEAQAAGRPVIARGAGGARESIVDGETGLFFAEPTVPALIDALNRFEQHRWDPVRARANAAHFGRARFQAEMAATVEAARAASDRGHQRRGR